MLWVETQQFGASFGFQTNTIIHLLLNDNKYRIQLTSNFQVKTIFD